VRKDECIATVAHAALAITMRQPVPIDPTFLNPCPSGVGYHRVDHKPTGALVAVCTADETDNCDMRRLRTQRSVNHEFLRKLRRIRSQDAAWPWIHAQLLDAFRREQRRLKIAALEPERYV